MTHHLDDQTLSDLLDDGLDVSARSAAEQHLTMCDACFTRLQRMRQVVEKAVALPRAVPAPPGEWGAIRARLHATASRSTPWWARRSVLLAAGLALVIASSAVTALVVGGGREVAVQPVPRVQTTALTPRLAALEQEYATVTGDLEEELAERKHALTPETIAAVERSLRTIEEAIAEAREALARDPGSETLARLLVAGHDQKVELLRQATRLATRS